MQKIDVKDSIYPFIDSTVFINNCIDIQAEQLSD